MKKNKITMIVVSIVVIITVIYGFLDGGSPQAARNKRFDDKRIQDIQMIKNWVSTYYNKNRVLPQTLLESSANFNNSGNTKIPTDPESNIEYKYQTMSNNKYKICTTFSTDTTDSSPQYLLEYSHPTGLYCLTFDSSRY